MIDDRFETVRNVISRFAKAGIPILYWRGRNKPPKTINNVRIVLLDLDLIGSGEGYDFYDDVASVLAKIPGPYAVLIVSVNATPDSPGKLETAFLEVNGREIPGFVIHHPFIKRGDQNVDAIIDTIKNALMKNSLFNCLLIAEQILEHAKDISLSELAQKRFDSSFKTLIKSIAKGRGEESVARELISFLVRLQARNAIEASDYDKLKLILLKISSEQVTGGSPDLNRRIMHLRTYYIPDPKEKIWTGDVYKTNFSDPARRYAILMTPACDISLGKATYLKFCYGFTISEKDLANQNHVLFSLDSSLKKTSDAKKYLGPVGVPIRFYALDNFRNSDTPGELERLLIDFQSIESIAISKFSRKRWRRLCRLDSPYVEDLLQKYGSHSIRIGTPAAL